MYKSNKSAFSPINQNIFLSKSHVLKFLKKKLRYSHIEKIYSFTVAEWKKSESDILNLITKNFNSAPVIVRSSAIGEDSIFESQAGNYDSIQNIDSLFPFELGFYFSK